MSSKVIITVHVEKTFIDANINTALVLVLLHGMYTIICGGTIYLYVTKKDMQNRLVVIVIAALYMVTVAQVGVQWKFTQLTFVENSETRLSAFIFSVTSTPSLEILGDVFQYIAYILADGLLIWRCFHMSDKSLLRISLPLILYTAEILSSFAAVILRVVVFFKPGFMTNQHEKVWNIVNGAGSIITALTSILATSIICYRIHTATRYDTRSRRRYVHIFQMLIESSMVYSANFIGLAVVDLLPFSTIGSLDAKDVAGNYLSTLAVMTTGIAPTLMVASIVLYSGAPPDPSTHTGGTATGPLSALRFHVHPPEETSAISHSEIATLREANIKVDSSASY